MSKLRAFWQKFEGSKFDAGPLDGQVETRCQALTRQVSDLGDAKLTAPLKLAVDTARRQAANKQYTDALATLDEFESTIKQTKLSALGGALDATVLDAKSKFPTLPKELATAERKAREEIEGQNLTTAQAAIDAYDAEKTRQLNAKVDYEAAYAPRKDEIRTVQARCKAGVYEQLQGGVLKVPADMFLQVMKVWEPQHNECDYDSATKTLKVVIECLDDLCDKIDVPDDNNALFNVRKAALEGPVKRCEEKIAKQGFGPKDTGPYAAAIKRLEDGWTVAGADGPVGGRLAALDAVELALADLATPLDFKEFDNRMKAVIDDLQRYESAVGTTAGPLGDLLATVKEDKRQADEARTRGDPPKAATHLKACEDGLAQFAVLGASKAKQTLVQVKNAKPADARRTLMAESAKNPAFLKALADSSGGPALLDTLVADLGGKLGGGEDKRFVADALKARFGIAELGGGDDGAGLSKKALPRIYAVMRLVPESHAKDNPSLQKLVRVKEGDTSWYRPDTKEVELHLGRTSGIGSLMEDINETRGRKNKPKGADLLMSYFDATTLHEIGHAVDDKEGFMKSKGSSPENGGWQKTNPDELVALMGNQLGFNASFKHLDRSLLAAYLRAVLGGRNAADMKGQFAAAAKLTAADLLKDPGVQAAVNFKAGSAKVKTAVKAAQKQVTLGDAAMKAFAADVIASVISDDVIDSRRKTVAEEMVGEHFKVLQAATSKSPPTDEDWLAMAQHPAVEWITAIRYKGKGLWDKGESGAKTYAVGGRVYQESYRNDWWSYNAAARGAGVSNYQWRAPGEWFAEVYSAFYLDRLSTSHPLHTWLYQQGPPRK